MRIATTGSACRRTIRSSTLNSATSRSLELKQRGALTEAASSSGGSAPASPAATALARSLDVIGLVLLVGGGQQEPEEPAWGEREQIGQLADRSEEHTSELQSLRHLVCRL